MSLYSNFFYFSLCHICKQPSVDLKRCSSCKSVYYCSTNHQKQDWRNHQRLCKVLTNYRRFSILPTNSTTEQFNKYKYSLNAYCRNQLKQLYNYENDITLFTRNCSVCFNENCDILCDYCKSVIYCTKQHQRQHREFHLKYCEQLKLCMAIYKAVFSEKLQMFDFLLNINNECKTLPPDIHKIMEIFLGLKAGNKYSVQHLNYIMMADHFSPGVALLYALEKAGFIENRCGNKEKLILHIVGADSAEGSILWQMIIEFFIHWIKNLKSIKILLIGPNAQLSSNPHDKHSYLCDDCRSRSITKQIQRIDGFYHNVIENLPKPDLIAAFNPGLSNLKHENHTDCNCFECDSWSTTIPFLIQYDNVPLLLTAYTENELKSDLLRFNNHKIQHIIDLIKNPYGNLRPIRNWEEGDCQVFYQNNYLTVITKKI